MAVYLLAAAVNFDATIFDSNDLSVIRGSSFAVLRFGDGLLQHLTRALGASAVIESLYSGASEIVVRVSPKQAPRPQRVTIEAPFGPDQKWRKTTLPSLLEKVAAGSRAEEVAQEWVTANAKQIKDADKAKKAIVRQINYLQAEQAVSTATATAPVIDEPTVDAAVQAFFAAPTPAKLKYFTFAHACCTTGRDDRLADILAVLTSRLRTCQLQSPTVALPEAVTSLAEADNAFCPFTLWRHPAAPGKREKNKPISASAQARRRDGRERKKDFYLDQIRRSANAARDMTLADTGAAATLDKAAETLDKQTFAFANDFEAMVDNPPEGLPPNVTGKLAVIFIDGNGFTKKRERCADHHSVEEGFKNYRRFCLALERNGGLILAGLLQWMRGEPKFLGKDNGETCLRFETLLFGGDDVCFVVPAWGGFAFMGKLQEILAGLRAPVAGQNETPVTYKAGMVFADHKSPIRDLRRVAESLAYAAKETSGDRNIVQVMALEGLDRADLDPQRLRGELFGKNVRDDPGAFGLEGSQWVKIRKTVQQIGDKAGRSQLHKWYAKAEAEGILKLLGDDPKTDPLKTEEFTKRTQDFIDKFGKRLGELDVPGDVCDVLTGKDPLLASNAARWPLLPLHHVLTLANYIEAMPLADPQQAGGRIMTLFRYEIPLSITLISPFATRGLIVDRASIDLPLARNRDKQLILPGTLITGILRAALARLAEAVPGDVPLGNETRPLIEDVAALFGDGSKKDQRAEQAAWRVHNEPNRGQLAIRDLVILAKDWEEKRIMDRQDYPRIQIDEKLGSVREGFLQFVEMPFAIGREVTFEGIIDLKRGTVGPDRAVALLNKALALVPALGAIKSSGFGRLAHDGCKVMPAKPIHATSTPKNLRTGVPLEVSYIIDRPFLAGGRMASANLFKGSAVIPGSAIKGTLAETLRRAAPMSDAMRDLLAAVTIGHVFPKPAPAKAGEKRWQPIPLSLATVEHNTIVHLYDRLLADAPLDPPRIDRRARALTFLGDMKDKEPLRWYLGIAWDPPAYDVRTRTKIDPETGAAEYDAATKSGQLFSYAAVDPAGFDWQGRIVFPEGADPALVGEIEALLKAGIVGLGKTGAKVTGAIGGPVDVVNGQPPYALTLATPAVLNDLDALRAGRSLRDDYAAYWDGLGYTLFTFFAAQRLDGGYVALRYPPRPGACEPYLVTKPGSVFLVEPKANAVPLSDLLTFGLPPRGTIKKPEWENCPFLRENGFGEVRLDAVDHGRLVSGTILNAQEQAA